MVSTKGRANKFKIASLLALLTIGGIVYNEYSNSYDVQLKKEISQMSEAQLRDAIKECDVVLERLQQTIDSEETNPEERFEADQVFKSISKQREQFQKRLNKITKPRTMIFNLHDGSNSQ